MPENLYKPFTDAEEDIPISEIYPGFMPEEQAAAEETWRQYLAIVKRIFEYVSEENPEILTELEKRVRLRKEKGNSN